MKHYYFSATLCSSKSQTLYIVDHKLVDLFNYEIADNWLYDVLPVRDRISHRRKFIDLNLVPETMNNSFYICLVQDEYDLYKAISELTKEQDSFFERRRNLS